VSADVYLLFGLAAWLGMLLAPPAIARIFWQVATRRSSRWAIHLLFFPSVIVATAGFAQLVLFATHDDGEGTPGSGLALMPPLLVLLITISAYAIRLGLVALHAYRRRDLR
jgi:hypothetical protein